MTASLCIDVFSDLVCPWCFIGSTRLDQALAGLPGVEAEVCYHPFLLDPTTPPGGVSIPEKLRKKYGVDPRQVWSRAEAAARKSGLALDLSLQPTMYPTDAAHTLLRHAYAKGTQRALALALFRVYFQEAKDITDASLLADVASRHGFNRDEALELVQTPAELELTREEAISAAESGIRGVPFFVFGGRVGISGAQSVDVLQAGMRQALEPAESEPPFAGCP